MFVAVERRSISLDEPLPVNISEPGEYTRQSDLTPLEISSEKFVRSYGLHYAPLQRVGPRRASRLTGSITFDQPILGVIVQQDELLASSFLFSRRGKGEANPRRELQLTGEANGDRIFLSEDRMTSTLDLISPGRSSDLVRVIVEDDRRTRRHRHRQQRRKSFSSDTTNAEDKE